jgi:chromosome partitioning protein
MILTVASFKGGVGKTTTALHLAAFLQGHASTLLVDGDLNRSALQWAEAGKLPFRVCDERQGVRYARQHEHIVIDTAARPEPEDLKAIAKGCDLLILPCSPDALALSALSQMVDALQSLQTNYRVLLTLTPPRPSTAADDARLSLENVGLPLFSGQIRRLAAFQKAALAGVLVSQVRGDRMARIAWNSNVEVGNELLEFV